MYNASDVSVEVVGQDCSATVHVKHKESQHNHRKNHLKCMEAVLFMDWNLPGSVPSLQP